MIKGFIAPHDSLEWKECLRAIGIVIRDETGELFNDEGKSIICQECTAKLTVENIGMIIPSKSVGRTLYYCKEIFCAIAAVDTNGDEIPDDELEIIKVNIGADPVISHEKLKLDK